MSEERSPLGELLDGLGVTGQFAHDEHVTDAIVILKSIRASSGEPLVQVAHSPHTDWVTRAGMMHAAEDMANTGYVLADDDDDPDPEPF